MNEPIDGLSESLAIQNNDLSIFDDVDDIIGRAVTIGDPMLVFEYGGRMVKEAMLRGHALAKLLYRLRENWQLFQSAGIDEDLETMVFVNMGIKPQTTRKYILMWEALFERDDIEESTKLLLRGKPIRELLLLTAAVREGSIDNESLQEIGLGLRSARDAVQDARGRQTSSNSAIRIYIQMQDTSKFPAGVVYARRGNETEVLFEVDLEADPKSLKSQAMARILNASGVQEVYGAN